MQPRHWRSHYNAICRDWVAKHNRTTRNGVGNCSSKTGWISTPKQAKDDFEALFKDFLKGKLIAPKLRKSADKSLSQPGCSHSNTIYDVQLQKTIVLRMQPRHQATLTQPFQCDLQPKLQETDRTTYTGTTTRCRTQRRNPIASGTTAAATAHTRGTFHRRLQPLYTEKYKVSLRSPASSPKQSPCNLDAAIPMRSATTASRNA